MTLKTFLGAGLTVLALPTLASAQDANDWSAFHGNLAAQKYSPATQITPENVGDLVEVWSFHTGDYSDGSGDLPTSYFNSTPIYANETLYIGTAFYRIIALDPATGEEKWSFDTGTPLEALTQPGLKTRGVAYWEAEAPEEGQPCQKRVYLGTMDAKLFAVDADTGERCADFGQNGMLDINVWNTTNDKWPLSVLQPPTVYGDQLFIGWAGYDFRYAVAPPGSVFAVDARTGELNWQVNFLPEEAQRTSGTANVWTNMTVDEERGILYMPVSSPSPNFWGGDRTMPIPMATSVTAADTETGEVLWAWQTIHHDVWDYDPVAAPTLVDVEVDGQMVPALVQVSKQGLLYVLNRVTGEPVWPIEEVPVPETTVEGEVVSPTQPIPTWPEPMTEPGSFPGIWRLADIASLGYCSRLLEDLRFDGLYTPPTTEGEGTLMWPSFTGGMEWGGGSFDPNTGIYVINTSQIANYLKLIPREEFDQLSDDEKEKSGFDYYAQEGAPYAVRSAVMMNGLGMPCWKPPFGELAAYNMHTGERIWRRPFGRSQRYGFYMPGNWGSPNIGGPAQTASGLIFIGATMDGYVRAFSTATGEELWSALVQAPAVANPAVFMHHDRQFVVFTAGGNSILKPDVSDQVVAFALPLDD